MTNAKPVGVAKNTSLMDTNTIVQQTENTIGALIGMGNLSDQTVLIFDADQYKPPKHAVIVKKTDPVPPNTTKVCDGKIFVDSQLIDCTAFRPA